MIAGMENAKSNTKRWFLPTGLRWFLLRCGMWFGTLVCACLGLLVVLWVLSVIASRSPPTLRSFAEFGGLVLVGLLAAWGFARFHRCANGPCPVFEHRRINGWCLQCGYDRSNLAKTARCPECADVPGV